MNAIAPTLAVGSVLAVAVMVWLIARRRRERQAEETLAASIAAGQHIPPSLHPVIDAERCIGSFSCIRACPEGDILAPIGGLPVLVEASHCIGHSRCAIECPVGAIALVFGTKEKGIDLPENDESFESSRPGVYVIGELGGMGLIKNALRQGLDVADVLEKRLRGDARGAPSAPRPGMADVVIVGGGPAGIACAVGCRKHGLDAVCVEQEASVGGTIAHYPRGKIVMTERLTLPFLGPFGRPLIAKEELAADLDRWMKAAGVQVRTSTRVEKIEGESDAFVVQTNAGPIAARAVVLAIGLRGSPRKLGVPGEEKPKVVYRLVDPEQFHGRRVLVVGGGDSAVEAALQLAEESTAKVTISYRQDAFSRCKPRNKERIAKRIEEGRIRALLPSEVLSIHDSYVVLKLGDETARLQNDDVLVSIGGEVPTAFLKAAGVSIKRYAGEAKAPPVQSGPPRGPSKAEIERRANRRFAAILIACGAAVVGTLFAIGADYYLLPVDAREASVLHAALRPAGVWGHGVGVVSTLFMLTTLSYAARKRLRRFKGKGSIQRALIFHIFAGTLSPILIGFHAAFLVENLLALWTWIALAILVATGAFGRVLLPWLPSAEGRSLSFTAVRDRMSGLEKELAPRFAESMSPHAVQSLFSAAKTTPLPRSFWAAVAKLPALRREREAALAAARTFFADAGQIEKLREAVFALDRAKFQLFFYGHLRAVAKSWLVVHVVLSVFMLVLLTAHIAVSLAIGYRWVFSA